MRAVQFHGKEDVRLNDIPTPDVSPGHVRIRPAFVGICGTGVSSSTVQKIRIVLRIAHRRP